MIFSPGQAYASRILSLDMRGKHKDIRLKSYLSPPLLENGSWFGGLFIVLVFIVTFYVAVWPIVEEPNANNLFLTYLAAPIVLTCVSFLFRSSSRCIR